MTSYTVSIWIRSNNFSLKLLSRFSVLKLPDSYITHIIKLCQKNTRISNNLKKSNEKTNNNKYWKNEPPLINKQNIFNTKNPTHPIKYPTIHNTEPSHPITTIEKTSDKPEQHTHITEIVQNIWNIAEKRPAIDQRTVFPFAWRSFGLAPYCLFVRTASYGRVVSFHHPLFHPILPPDLCFAPTRVVSTPFYV